MRLGVIFCAYDCNKLLAQVLQPWLEARREIDIKIATVHGQFLEYHNLGIEDNDIATQKRLQELSHKRIIDFLYLQNDYFHYRDKESFESFVYQTEAEIRNYGLRYLLNEKCDYVILLDGDEIYTIEDIRSIYNYIQKDPFIALYKIKMRNLIFDNHYTLDFCPPRVWKVNLANYTLNAFNFDNDCTYKGILTRVIKYDKNFPCKIIPNVLPDHHSWNDLERSKKKILYQKIHFSHGAGCSFKVSEDGSKLEWNEEYFKKTRQIKPEVYEL